MSKSSEGVLGSSRFVVVCVPLQPYRCATTDATVGGKTPL
jgi:hypothetical protein